MSNIQPATTIVIVNYNGNEVVLGCIESIRKFTQNCEVLIVDNASTDGSVESLEKLFPDVRIIKNDINLGFAKANNIGIRESRGTYLVLMNPDVTVTEHWLERLVSSVEKGPRIGIATPKLLTEGGRLDSTGHSFRFLRLEAKNRGQGEQDRGQYDDLTELLSCDFACSMIKREVTIQIGLLDEAIFLDHEDIDYCLRARVAGWRVVFCPSSVVYHHRGHSSSKYRRMTRQLQARKYLLRLVLKSYGLPTLVQVLAYKQRDLLSFVAALLVALKNHDPDGTRRALDEISALLVAFLWNAAHLPIKERLFVQKSRQVSDEQLHLISG